MEELTEKKSETIQQPTLEDGQTGDSPTDLTLLKTTDVTELKQSLTVQYHCLTEVMKATTEILKILTKMNKQAKAGKFMFPLLIGAYVVLQVV